MTERGAREGQHLENARAYFAGKLDVGQQTATIEQMGQPVKLSDDLILDARLAAEIAECSVADQIEFWAQLGRAIEPLLGGTRALALRRVGAVKLLSQCLATVD